MVSQEAADVGCENNVVKRRSEGYEASVALGYIPTVLYVRKSVYEGPIVPRCCVEAATWGMGSAVRINLNKIEKCRTHQ